MASTTADRKMLKRCRSPNKQLIPSPFPLPLCMGRSFLFPFVFICFCQMQLTEENPSLPSLDISILKNDSEMHLDSPSGPEVEILSKIAIFNSLHFQLSFPFSFCFLNWFKFKMVRLACFVKFVLSLGEGNVFQYLNLIEGWHILFCSFFNHSKHVLFRFFLRCVNFPYALSGWFC